MHSSSPYVIGLDLGGTAIKAGAFTVKGEMLASCAVLTGDGDLIDGAPAWAIRIRQVVSDFNRDLGGPARAMGLSAPGLAATHRTTCEVGSRYMVPDSVPAWASPIVTRLAAAAAQATADVAMAAVQRPPPRG